MGRSVKLDVSPTHLLIWSCIASQLRQRWKRELSQVGSGTGCPLYEYKYKWVSGGCPLYKVIASDGKW